MEGEEPLLSRILLDHPEFHAVFESRDGEVDLAKFGGINPFLHVGLHLVVEQQRIGQQPPEVAQALVALQAGGVSRHEAIHQVGGVLAQVIQDAVTRNKPMDTGRYLLMLRKLICGDL